MERFIVVPAVITKRWMSEVDMKSAPFASGKMMGKMSKMPIQFEAAQTARSVSRKPELTIENLVLASGVILNTLGRLLLKNFRRGRLPRHQNQIMNFPSSLSDLPTEAANPNTANLSELPTLEALQLINDEDQKVAVAVREVLGEVARAIEQIAPRMAGGGRLFYIGAGTSGRLGVIDASECPPTFGVAPDLVQGIIAGGPDAVFRSREGAEDSPEGGARDLQNAGVNQKDCVVGLAASGRTPYVLGALDWARQHGCFTAGVSVNPAGAMRNHCEIYIAPAVGPEALTGSTRLKAGTAQKLILNMISTGVMLNLGRVQGNLMTHLKPSCGKLRDRARRLVMELSGADETKAGAALEACGGDVERAVAALADL